MTHEIEATLVCPDCGFSATLFRVPTQSEGVYTNRTEPEVKRGECLKCGCQMERCEK